MYAERLAHTCTILRASTTANALNETVEVYAPYATQVPCLFMESTERVFASDRGEWIQIPVTKLFFLPDQDVAEKDRFTDIAIEDGSSASGTWYVESDLTRRIPGRGVHHRTMQVKKLSG